MKVFPQLKWIGEKPAVDRDDGEVDKKDKKRKKRAALFFRKTNNADKVS